MKRAAGRIVAACFFKLYVTIYQIDNVGAVKKVINK
jgi:hypothetical protein